MEGRRPNFHAGRYVTGFDSTLAQLVEPATVNRVVPGSNPGGGAK